MNSKAGLWIDREKAVIVFITGGKEDTVLVESKVRKKFRSPTGKSDGNPNGRRYVTSDDIQERVSTEHLGMYYDKVITCLRKAESVLIFGPGESKGELHRRMKKDRHAGRIAGIETVGKMTVPQIAAKARGYFHSRDRREGIKKVTSHAMPDFHISRRKTDIV